MTVMDAFRLDDAAAVKALLAADPKLVKSTVGDFGSPLVVMVKSRAMLDVLLDAGADINARSTWWAGGFGLLDSAEPELAAYAIERGAKVTAHAAARLGMLEKLQEIVAADPEVVHAKGGDGQRPLHFAATEEIAAYLLDNGADINAQDVDHVSTAVQWMVKSRPAVARYLISRGAKADILAAAKLGDLELARKLWEADPECLRMRVSEEYFPVVGHANGGTIYQWELGWYVGPVQVATDPEMLRWLDARTPEVERLVNACWAHEDVTAGCDVTGRRELALAARNNNTEAAKRMLQAGFPVDATGQHRGTALHWAAWHGNAELVDLLLRAGADRSNAQNDYRATPMGWAEHGQQNGWYKDKGDYPATKALLAG